MSTKPRLRKLALALGLAALVPVHGQPVRDSNAVAGVEAVPGPKDTIWIDIQNDTYDQRAHFERGVDRLSAKLDEQIRILRAKRASMTGDTKDWDFYMKDVDTSRVLLSGMMSDLAKATTPEAWSAAKDKVGEAWRRSQAAVDRMNSTRTS